MTQRPNGSLPWSPERWNPVGEQPYREKEQPVPPGRLFPLSGETIYIYCITSCQMLMQVCYSGQDEFGITHTIANLLWNECLQLNIP